MSGDFGLGYLCSGSAPQIPCSLSMGISAFGSKGRMLGEVEDRELLLNKLEIVEKRRFLLQCDCTYHWNVFKGGI